MVVLVSSYIFVSATCRMKNSPAQRLRAEATVKLMGEAWRASTIRVSALAGACLHLQPQAQKNLTLRMLITHNFGPICP